MQSEHTIIFALNTMQVILDKYDETTQIMIKANCNALSWVLHQDPPYPELWGLSKKKKGRKTE